MTGDITDRVATSTAGSGSRGFIVVAVLWILAALAALVLVYLVYVTNTAVVVAGSTDRVQTEALARAAVELTAYQLTSATEDTRPTSGTFDAKIGRNRISVTFQSEAARIDLNAAPKELLAGFFTGLGAKPAAADGYADRIVAWRTSATDDDAENSFYRTSGLAYVPRHAPFPSVQELWLVLGIPPIFVERLLPFATVFSNIGTVNIADAAPQVLAALPGMTPENLQTVLAQRGDPRVDPQSLLPLAGNGGSLTGSKAFRVSVAMTLENGRRTGAEVVILLLDDANEPYRVLSWRNFFDGGAGPQQAFLQ